MERVMGRRQPVKPEVKVIFTPVADWDNRLKRVMALLLRSLPDESSSKATTVGTDRADKEVTNTG